MNMEVYRHNNVKSKKGSVQSCHMDREDKIIRIRGGNIMKKGVVAFAICLVLCVGLVPEFSYAAEKVFKLEFSSFVSPQSKSTKLMDEWCRDIEKRTNGQVKITQHPGSTLT